MQRRHTLALAFGSAVVAAAALASCASTTSAGWTTLIDGEKGLDNFDRVGDANWRSEGGAIVADQGRVGFLVTKQTWRDFELRAEFHAMTETNSGVFLRLSDPVNITADNSYEVNIWDIRPEPKYGTGAIVGFAEVPVPIANTAGGRWNVYEIEAKGSRVTVKLNGVQTAVMNNDKFASGPFALQFAPGVGGATGGPIKWRKVQIKPL
jgi:Domain of Unknown Function (DUF1080)